MNEKSVPVVLLISTDLFFGMRIKNSTQQLGIQFKWIETLEAWQEAWEEMEAKAIAIVLLDLASKIDWQQLLIQTKKDEQNKSIPWIAFGSHVNTEILQVARKLGADQVMAKSKFTKSLPEILSSIK